MCDRQEHDRPEGLPEDKLDQASGGFVKSIGSAVGGVIKTVAPPPPPTPS